MRSKWEYPKIQDLDDGSFNFIRHNLYNLLHELHMAENYKIVNPEKEYNVYWENFCEMVEYLTMRVDEAACHEFVDSQSSARRTIR